MNALACLVSWSALLLAAEPIQPHQPNVVTFPPQQAQWVRFVIHASSSNSPCLDELEVYGPDAARNLALAKEGAKATASSLLPGYPIHQIEHLNDGRYGNDFSWIAADRNEQWAQIELAEPADVASVIFSRDRAGRYSDRVPVHFEVQLSVDGQQWQTVREVKTRSAITVRRPRSQPEPRPSPPFLPQPVLPETFDASETSDTPTTSGKPNARELLQYAFLCEAQSWWRIDRVDPIGRVLDQTEAMLARFEATGQDVTAERVEFADLHHRWQSLKSAMPQDNTAEYTALFFDVRLAKRRLMFRSPELTALRKILFVKRHAFRPSHNYSVILDAQGGSGGAVCMLEIPASGGRLEPLEAEPSRLFEAEAGVARNPAADFDASKIYFGYRPTDDGYYHLMVMDPDGNDPRQLTDGPFHDYWPCPLPDGGLAFISTRCKSRFLCWRPQAFVLFRMDADGSNIRPLSFANLSEWAPSVAPDGRILWTRSEYLDKGADFGHTLWAVRPDGTHPELIFGNNTIHCYANGREVPGTREICCTLISHGGDLNGPIALIDPSQGRFEPKAITNITPDSRAYTHMTWARRECFRDPVPVTRDYFLCSHAPEERFGLYLIDRFGNREVLHLDPAIDAMCPTWFHAVPTPPVLGVQMDPDLADPDLAKRDLGQFTVADVYQGLEPAVERGSVRYLRVCQEVRADLLPLPEGGFQKDHEPFQDWYATPIHKVNGPGGWPSYVAKAVLGTVPVEADGSANFLAPAGKVLYFQALDRDFNELQRMRSVIQLQPGEKRSCVGCHENRRSTASIQPGVALLRPPRRLEPPAWGAGPFSYEKVVQPVWNAQCIGCHDAADEQKFDLTATLDSDKVPASYRTLIAGGWVHYFDCTWREEHTKADPLTFGTVKSKLWQVLDQGHHDVQLTPDQTRRVKCWIDLNCPLWPDYRFRPSRAPHSKS